MAAKVDTGVMAAAGVITPLRGIAGSALLAAGVVVALAERRPRRNADDAVDDFETMLRLAADVGAARFVDQALRVLSAELTQAGRALPPVYAATLSDSALLLHIAPAEPEGPPPPWRVGEIPGHWLIDRLADTPDGLPAGVVAGIPASTPAPYPGLATVGTDDHGAQILVDIEGAPGIISLVGDAAVAREAVVSIAVELATNLWSDDLRVYMIGFPDLTAPIVPDRLRTSSSLDEVLGELSDRGSRHGGAAGGTRDPAGSGREHSGHGNDVNSTFDAALRGRQAARTQALWAPDLLVLPEPPSGDDVARLSVLAAGRTQGIGVITVGDTAAARWRFTVDAERRLSLGVLGLDVNALTLSAPEYAAILAMFSQPDAGSTSGDTRGPEPRALPAAPSRAEATDRTQPRIAITDMPWAALPNAEIVRSVDGGSSAAASAPGPELTPTPAPAPVPWVPEIPRWMRPLGSGARRPSPGAPDSQRDTPIPSIPPIPPPPPPATRPHRQPRRHRPHRPGPRHLQGNGPWCSIRHIPSIPVQAGKPGKAGQPRGPQGPERSRPRACRRSRRLGPFRSRLRPPNPLELRRQRWHRCPCGRPWPDGRRLFFPQVRSDRMTHAARRRIRRQQRQQRGCLRHGAPICFHRASFQASRMHQVRRNSHAKKPTITRPSAQASNRPLSGRARKVMIKKPPTQVINHAQAAPPEMTRCPGPSRPPARLRPCLTCIHPPRPHWFFDQKHPCL